MSETPGNDAVITKIVVPDTQSMVALLGSRDELLQVIEKALVSDVHVRGNEITITGSAADNAIATRLFDALITLLDKGQPLSADAVERSLAMLTGGGGDRPADVLTLNIVSNRGRTIRPKTVNQKRYVEAIDEHTIVFGIGPAGTGKTYLAMAKAVQALQAKQVNRIILTRPAVEAGERLGFLPGTLYDKIDPYLRPLYDALHDMLDPESIPRLMAAGTIEVAPLAYMRGRAQPVDTLVLTPEGYLPLGDLVVGDLVYGSDGRPTPVLGVYPQGRKDVYRVTTQDGASTLACAEHLWSVRTRDDARRGRPGRVVETREMLGRLRRHHRRNYELPVVAPVEFPPTEVRVDPYALGLLLGGGRVDAFEGALPHLEPSHQGKRHSDGGPGGVRTAGPVTTALGLLGPAGTRPATTSVPPEYLLNSAAVRRAVLQGLLDADGVPVAQPGRTGRIHYTTRSRQLRDDVVWLVRSLGGVASGRDAHLLDIRLPAGVEPFRLAGKKTLYDATGGGRPRRFIDTIEPAGEAECVCICVGAADSLYVTEDFLVTHNTLNDAFIILDEAQNTSAEQMKMFLTRLGFGSKIVVTGDVTQVDLPGGTISGLKVVREILHGVEDVHFSMLTSEDVVRHRLVGRIVDAYALYDAELARGPGRGPGRRDDSRRGSR
jgi:phosphate starvation-inducible PhoH-like protein